MLNYCEISYLSSLLRGREYGVLQNNVRFEVNAKIHQVGFCNRVELLTLSMQNSKCLSERLSGDRTWLQGGSKHDLDKGPVL